MNSTDTLAGDAIRAVLAQYSGRSAVDPSDDVDALDTVTTVLEVAPPGDFELLFDVMGWYLAHTARPCFVYGALWAAFDMVDPMVPGEHLVHWHRRLDQMPPDHARAIALWLEAMLCRIDEEDADIRVQVTRLSAYWRARAG